MIRRKEKTLDCQVCGKKNFKNDTDPRTMPLEYISIKNTGFMVCARCKAKHGRRGLEFPIKINIFESEVTKK